jgi:hypothetical protein
MKPFLYFLANLLAAVVLVLFVSLGHPVIQIPIFFLTFAEHVTTLTADTRTSDDVAAVFRARQVSHRSHRRASSMKRLLCGVVALGVLLGGAVQAKADYIYTTLDVPGSFNTIANGINDARQPVRA